jgi:hypothetical protein
MSAKTKIALFLFAIVAVAIVIWGLSGLRRLTGAQATPTPVPQHALPLVTTPQPTWTLVPTITPQLTPPATATPSLTSTPTPATPGTLSMEMTEEEVNAYLAGQSFSQQGAGVSDLRVKITTADMRIEGYIQHEATGFAGDITIAGVPQVVEGELYFQVTSVTLGPQFSGLVRMIAQGMIQEALKLEAGPNGLPIPVKPPEGMVITSVTLGDGRLLLEGVRE